MEKIATKTEYSIKRMYKNSMKKCNAKGWGMERVEKSSAQTNNSPFKHYFFEASDI